MRILVVYLLLLSSQRSHSFDCDLFTSSVCRLNADNVVSIQNYEDDTGNLDNQCQKDCLQEPHCRNFTFFSPTVPGLLSTCILFNECRKSSFCGSCVSGPPVPPLDDCGVRLLLDSILEGSETIEQQRSREPKQLDEDINDETEEIDDPRATVGAELDAAEASGSTVDGEETTEIGESEEDTDTSDASIPTEEVEKMEDAAEVSTEEAPSESPIEEEEDTDPDNPDNTTKSSDVDKEMDSVEGDEDLPEVEGVDDGLLEGDNSEEFPEEEVDDNDSDNEEDEEDFFGEEDYVDNEPEEEEREGSEEEQEDNSDNEGKKKRPSFVYCLMGGYGPLGPISTFGHLGAFRRPVVPPLPPAFPLGSAGMFGTMFRGNLMACSPGASINPSVLRPFIGGVPFVDSLLSLGIPRRPRFLAPGQCYTNRNSNWLPMGGPMSTARLGSSISRMGNFLITMGGKTSDAPNDEVEVLNLNKPEKWRKLSKITMRNPTYDHCSVALNKTSLLVTGGAGQGNSVVIMNMKTKEVTDTAPMREPRSKHSCLKMKINGRPGVLVAGGSNGNRPALRSVEFFDEGREKWIPLGNLRQGRRFPGIMVQRNRLVIAGGETTDPFGQNIILDGMERLGRKRFRPMRSRLPQARSRFASIRVPLNFF